MNGWNEFERLARVASADVPEPVDVTEGVMRRIAGRGAPGQADLDLTLVLFAAGSLAAAGIVAALALGWWSDLNDPLPGLLQALSVLMR
jgi:hypothetical protein